MADFERTLIKPSREELLNTLANAAMQANHKCRQHVVNWPLGDLERMWRMILGVPEGHGL